VFLKEARENHLQSPTRRMALHVSCMAREGQVKLEESSDLVRLLTLNAFIYRARRLRSDVGEGAVEANGSAHGDPV